MNIQKSTLFDELNRLGHFNTLSRNEFVFELKNVRLKLEKQFYQNRNLTAIKGVLEVQFLDWENLCANNTNTIIETQKAILRRNSIEGGNFMQMELSTL
jgi:hypothetical protein